MTCNPYVIDAASIIEIKSSVPKDRQWEF